MKKEDTNAILDKCWYWELTPSKKKRETTQCRNERGATTTDPMDTGRLMKEYYEQLCAQKFDNLD